LWAAGSVQAVADEFAEMRQRRGCAATGCDEEVAFSIFAGAVGRDEAKYSGRCANGHRNVLTVESRRQWVEDEGDD
jgi:hypothetical protein